MRSAVACCLSVLSAFCTPALAGPLEAREVRVVAPSSSAQLLAELAKSPGVYARFVEKRTMALLAAPLESEGELFYAVPGLLARYTRKPEVNTVVLDPQRVRLHDGKSWQSVDFANKPLVRQFAESFVSILRGDLVQLERLYRLEWTQQPNQRRWTLTLKPKQAPMDKIISRMELHGEGLVIATVRLVEVGGDETLTTYSEVDTSRTFSPAERERIFALERR